MYRIKPITFSVLISLFLAAVCSCSATEEDERWSPMVWTSKLPGNPKDMTVPARGGSFRLTCTNYHHPWLTDVKTADTTVHATVIGQDFLHIRHNWYDVEVKKNVYHITIQPNTSGKLRCLYIGATAGDIFDRIKITQEK